MQFTSPLFFLLSLFIAAVILFYFFRKQYEITAISSNLLWEEVLNEWQASPFLKKLQQNLLFWLQILALVLLMFAIIRPFWYVDGLRGEQIIFIIDSSATMSAKEGNSNGFEQAKQELKELARQLNGQEVTIITAGQVPEIILNYEQDKRAVLEAIDKLELTYEHENIEKALRLAQSISSPDHTSLYIFSDRLTKKIVNQNVGDQYVEVHNHGEDQANLSLASFGVGPVNGKIAGVAVIENQSEQAQNLNFSVRGEKKALFTEEVTINANESFVLSIPELPDHPYYEALINNDDAYMIDNQMTAIYRNPIPSLYVLNEANPFVIKGFATIGVDLIQTEAANRNIDKEGIIVTEGSSFASLPNQPVILFNNSNEKVALTQGMTGKEDSLMEYVQPEKMYIGYAVKNIESEFEFETVLKSGDVPLIQKGMRNGEPVIVVNFLLSDSDWPLQPDFPIFLYNSYQWLSQQRGFLGYFNPGEKKWLNTSTVTSRLEIFNAQDENVSSFDMGKESFTAPFLPGTYQAVANDEISYFSVLLDDREKSLETSPSFTLNAYQGEEEGSVKRPNDILWFVFAALAFVLIAAEWEVYRRGLRG